MKYILLIVICLGLVGCGVCSANNKDIKVDPDTNSHLPIIPSNFLQQTLAALDTDKVAYIRPNDICADEYKHAYLYKWARFSKTEDSLYYIRVTREKNGWMLFLDEKRAHIINLEAHRIIHPEDYYPIRFLVIEEDRR